MIDIEILILFTCDTGAHCTEDSPALHPPPSPRHDRRPRGEREASTSTSVPVTPRLTQRRHTRLPLNGFETETLNGITEDLGNYWEDFPTVKLCSPWLDSHGNLYKTLKLFPLTRSRDLHRKHSY